jgi:predicted benzoate:H+ symporter BenE
MQASRVFVGLLCAALATVAGIFLPFILHGVRNLPWEVIFGAGFYITWFLRDVVGERIEGLLGGLLWPVVVIASVWYSTFRLCGTARVVRVAAVSLFMITLLVCISSDTANSLAVRVPLYLNEFHVLF